MDFDTFAAFSGGIKGVDITDFVAGSHLGQLESSIAVEINFTFYDLSINNQFITGNHSTIVGGESVGDSVKSQIATLGVVDGIGYIGIKEIVAFCIVCISKNFENRNN